MNQLSPLTGTETRSLQVHSLFRYPAKFHSPVARNLVTRFCPVGGTVYDPFCGSGTVLVEAQAMGRAALGSDIDPVAVAVASAKLGRHELDAAERVALQLCDAIRARRFPRDYRELMFSDLTSARYEQQLGQLGIQPPPIPNRDHWFRRYVMIDLLLIQSSVRTIPRELRSPFVVALLSCIRHCSNADPVPVSGVEYTSHMRRLDEKGRLIDPVGYFLKRLRKVLDALREFEGLRLTDRGRVFQADARRAGCSTAVGAVDCIITSPPYSGAVDYYRRNGLESYWLDEDLTPNGRQKTREAYIGGPSASTRSARAVPAGASLAAHWAWRFDSDRTAGRAAAFRQYLLDMHDVFEALASLISRKKPVVVAIGESSFDGARVPVPDILIELASTKFHLTDRMQYPIKNRYMSYARHNGADINTDHILVMERT